MRHPWAVQRIELFASGVKVPPLGSLQDKILRQYQLKKAFKEVSKQKAIVLGLIAVAGANKASKSVLELVLSTFDDYSSQELYLERALEEMEKDMRQELEFWKLTKPKVSKGKDGKLELSIGSLKPK